MDVDILVAAQKKWGIHLHQHGSDPAEHVGPCPFCTADEDGFHVWTDDGNYWCRRCGRTGFVLNGNDRELTPEEREEIERKRRERERERRRRYKSALAKMAASNDHINYHHNLNEEHLLYWYEEGFLYQTIKHWKLGYCPSCPTDWVKESGNLTHRGLPSYTIPVINNGVLANIRHRLIGASGGDKYRPHMSGLPPTLFGLDSITNAPQGSSATIVEGEKKTMIALQAGMKYTCGTMGQSTFMEEWVPWFDKFKRIYVAFDPDATKQAARTASMFGERGRIVWLPDKLDDLIIHHGAELDDLRDYWFYATRPPELDKKTQKSRYYHTT